MPTFLSFSLSLLEVKKTPGIMEETMKTIFVLIVSIVQIFHYIIFCFLSDNHKFFDDTTVFNTTFVRSCHWSSKIFVLWFWIRNSWSIYVFCCNWRTTPACKCLIIYILYDLPWSECTTETICWCGWFGGCKFFKYPFRFCAFSL